MIAKIGVSKMKKGKKKFQTLLIFGYFKTSDHMHFKEKSNSSVFYLVRGLEKATVKSVC